MRYYRYIEGRCIFESPSHESAVYDRFSITKKYGDHGLHLKSLIQELQPELAQAASKVRDDVDHAKEIAETDAKNVEFNRAISLKAIQDAKDEDAAKANFDAGN